MKGILYFSSTGNSLYIAKKLKESIGGNIVYIPNYAGTCDEFEAIYLVTPIYSYGMPKHVYDLLPRLNNERPLVVIQNYGGMVAGADYLMLEYCQKYSLNIKGIFTIKMPENFTTTFTVPKFYIKSTLKKADANIQKVIDDIKAEKFSLPKKKKTREDKYLTNMSNWHIIGERFNVSDACIKCGKCINLCPVKNIEMKDGKICFGDKCVACLGCYHRCPKKAIRYKNHKKKDRYINPNIDENQIGKDIE